MQLFLEIVFQLSIFLVNILLPLSIAFVVIGKYVHNNSILKAGFWSSVAVIVLYVIILALQIQQIVSANVPLNTVFGSAQGIFGLVLTIVVPVVIATASLVVANLAHKK
jgi:uncharacterized membrane protein YkvI